MAAAAASATRIAPQDSAQPMHRALHTNVAFAEPAPAQHRRRTRPAPRPPATGPDMEAIYFDPHGITKTRRRGTIAHRFLAVDAHRRKPFDLLVGDDLATELQFGGAYRLHLDYSDRRDQPLVVRKPEYISRSVSVRPYAVMFDINTQALDMSLCGSDRRMDFARGAEAAALLVTMGYPGASWQPVEGHESARMLVGMPEQLTVHSVVTAPQGKWHAMGLPSLPGARHLIAPVVSN